LRLSLIIPAFNEADRIVPSLRKIVQYLRAVEYESEILVVDDGSPDKTSEVAQNALTEFLQEPSKVSGRVISLQKNLGKGGAVATGMLAATGDVRIFTDADLSTPINEVEKVIPLIATGQYDVVIGSRAAEERTLVKKHQPWYREMMGRFFNVLVQTFVFRGFKDTQCGFKGFSAKAAQYLFSRQKITGFTFDVEMLYLAKQAGFKIKEVAIEWYNDERTTVGAVSDSTKMIFELLRIKQLHKGESVS
jgi:dolichyl-phosphate beta-glucosyltransferase